MGDVIPFEKPAANIAPLVSDYWGENAVDLLTILAAIEKAKEEQKPIDNNN